jgi:N-acetylneuraminic acid mutarotase
VGGGNNGDYFSSAELYEPETGTWGKVSGHLATARFEHTAILLSNGKVLIAGGVNAGTFIASTELYNPGETSPSR